MPRLHMTDMSIRNLKPPPPPKQEDYFDDPAMGGVQGLMMRISYGGTKAWYCMFYEGGKSKLFKLGRYPVLKLQKARQQALAFLADPKKHTEKQAPPETFEKIATDFLRLHVAKSKLRTAKVIEQRMKKHLLPTFKDTDFAAIRRRDLTALLDEIEEEHGAAMADAILSIFRSIANWHSSRDEDYRSPIGPKMKRSKAKPRSRTLTDDELRLFWTVTGSMGTFGALARVILLTGQRRSKVNFMKWSDIKAGTWHLETAENEKPNCGRIKLPKPVLAIIEAQPRIDRNPFVFTGERGRGAFNSFGQYAIALMKEMRAVLPEMPTHTMHDLRRTMRTRLSRIGIEPHVAERCLGHIVGNQIERTYDHHDFHDEMTQAFEAFAAHVISTVQPPPPNVVRLPRGRRAAGAAQRV